MESVTSAIKMKSYQHLHPLMPLKTKKTLIILLKRKSKILITVLRKKTLIIIMKRILTTLLTKKKFPIILLKIENILITVLKKKILIIHLKKKAFLYRKLKITTTSHFLWILIIFKKYLRKLQIK